MIGTKYRRILSPACAHLARHFNATQTLRLKHSYYYRLLLVEGAAELNEGQTFGVHEHDEFGR